MVANLFEPFVLLSAIVFLPAAGALLLAFIRKEEEELIKLVSFLVTAIVFGLTLLLVIPGHRGGNIGFSFASGSIQHACNAPWVKVLNIRYFFGVDGISVPLVVLTSFISMLAMLASWSIKQHVKAYCMLFLILETGMLGVFMALDFFLFYVFWEVMLLPMYFLIGLWGGPRREYAAIKFFLFTLVGSVLMLVAILVLYFASDLRLLSPAQLEACFATEELAAVGRSGHTFNMLALAEIGQMAGSPFNRELLLGKSIQWWAFVLLLIGFLIKVPSVPVHTWLPDAHVEAPTPISMILAGILLKMGGYGLIRICYPICPAAAYQLAWLVCGLGLLSMVYGAFAALAQQDFKRLVAYSSVSHMGYVVLGLGAWSMTLENGFIRDYWIMGASGAMFQMIAHGITSPGMFFLVGVVYDRVHHRDLNRFGAVFRYMPVYGGVAMVIFFAAMGLPGLCGFWGELPVVLAAWRYNPWVAVVAASVVIVTAGYILWTLKRVLLGAEYKGPHAENLYPMTKRELAVALPLVALAIWFGIYPRTVFSYITPSVTRTASKLGRWMEEVKYPEIRQAITVPGDDVVGEHEVERAQTSGSNALSHSSKTKISAADGATCMFSKVDHSTIGRQTALQIDSVVPVGQET